MEGLKTNVQRFSFMRYVLSGEGCHSLKPGAFLSKAKACPPSEWVLQGKRSFAMVLTNRPDKSEVG